MEAYLGPLVRRSVAKVIFADRAPFSFQKVAQRIIGGPRSETIRFADGSLFDCFTSEKYYWLREAYEEDERRGLEAYVTSRSVIFDVGAHAGFWEVTLSDKCRHIYAFEPSPRNFSRLRRNILQNGIQNVTLVPAAACNENGTLHFIEDGSMSHVVEAGVPVPAIKLDDYVRQHVAPDIVKIDIEGYGAVALSGLAGTLAERHPLIFIELHNEEEVSGCHAVVDKFGYTSLPLDARAKFPYRVLFKA